MTSSSMPPVRGSEPAVPLITDIVIYPPKDLQRIGIEFYPILNPLLKTDKVNSSGHLREFAVKSPAYCRRAGCRYNLFNRRLSWRRSAVADGGAQVGFGIVQDRRHRLDGGLFIALGDLMEHRRMGIAQVGKALTGKAQAAVAGGKGLQQ